MCYRQSRLGRCLKEKSKKGIGYYRLKNQRITSLNTNKKRKKDGKQEIQ
jgi:hypothetical protein